MSERSHELTAEELEAEKSKNNLDAERLQATNARLLKESQDYKDKYKAVLKEKEDLEAKKLADSGDLAAQLEAEKKKARQALDELGKTKKKVVTQAVKDKISKYAGDVHNIDEIMNRPQLKSFLKEGLDEDNLDFNDEVAKRFIEEVKKESPYLWKVQGPIGANTGKPSNTGTAGTVDMESMSASELKEYISKTFK